MGLPISLDSCIYCKDVVNSKLGDGILMSPKKAEAHVDVCLIPCMNPFITYENVILPYPVRLVTIDSVCHAFIFAVAYALYKNTG